MSAPLPRLPKGRKVNVGWTTNGRRVYGTCWTNQVRSFLAGRILPGSTDIRLHVAGGRSYRLGDKEKD